MSKNRLFKKLFISNIIIILITLSILSGMFYLMFQNYYFADKEKIMLEEAQEINAILNEFAVGDINIDKWNQELNVVTRLINATVWIVDKEGLIYSQSQQQGKAWTGVSLSKEEIKSILDGQSVVKKGYFGGKFNQPVLTVGVPLVINGRIEGAIFMHAPLTEMNKTIINIFILMLLSGGVALIIGFVLISYTSSKISQPLKEMSLAVQQVAKGNFSARVQHKEEDEIGDLAKSFNVMAKELEQLEDMRKDFVANVSHELRSPLTSIQGYIDGILDGTIPKEKACDYLKIVQKETRRMSRLINDFLEMTKLESGQFPLNKTEFDINELIRLAVIKFEKRIVEKDLTVKVDFEEDRRIVIADKDKIEQVLTNLIDNAIKFSKEKGIIHIFTEIKDDKAFITIKDNGIGISPEDQEHIWDRFYKADKSRGKDGAGLGLYIVKRIINAHNEEIWVESELGKGTAFTFTLPMKKF
ncbi:MULTISPECIES: sensor histidine kinase [Thermoanaerobacter]|uniref:histidine kinase n=2 Tax=Thermoanaerobacter TaxID=1754 RepID=I9KTD6_9THEO|nr:integral membrane sensor signal transduction histidine kinase [Thermoanaerobacter wiegelii Rt8.B1]EGD51545.1 integral membrane sensor signal transduction histidine kinase [Thermoanaerobacter ethanolicus JW 200]EIW00091.1 signal transduction histidine kinase [Thermoanaerobacter siderophilus SR4]